MFMTIAMDRRVFALEKEVTDGMGELAARLADAERMIVMLRERVYALENGKGVPAA